MAAAWFATLTRMTLDDNPTKNDQLKGQLKAFFAIHKVSVDDRELLLTGSVEEVRSGILALLEPAAAAAPPPAAPPGGAAIATRLPRIDETQAAPGPTLRQLQQSMDKLQLQQAERDRQLQLQLHDMKASLTWRGAPVGDSATTLGGHIISQAQPVDLVTVDSAAITEAAAWVNRAGAAGQAWQQATQAPGTRASSTLLEGGEAGTQAILSAMLGTQPSGSLRLHDTHTSPSVCGVLKPDVVCTVATDGGSSHPMLPTNTVLILDIKRQGVPYNSPANIHQICSYGRALLDQLPPTARTSVLVAVTDLQRIQFYKMTRPAQGQGLFTYQRSQEISPVLPALCAVLRAEPNQFGATPPPQLVYQGRQLKLDAFLGMGATAMVFRCRLPPGSGSTAEGAEGVAKVTLHQHSASHEQSMLLQLSQLPQPGPFVPRVVGELDDGRGLLLQPVGTPLSFRTLEQHPRLFEVVGQAVGTLRAAHQLKAGLGKEGHEAPGCEGILHCDLRPDNMVLVPAGPQPRLYIIDWGCARSIPDTPVQATGYSGTIKFASQAVLCALAAGSDVARTPQDDLESLVKCFFFLTHQWEARELALVERYAFEAIAHVWEGWLRGRHAWQRIINAAAACDYDAVATGLVERLE